MAKNTHSSALYQKSSGFFRFYVTLVWILILLCVFGWIYLYKTLSSYEASLPATYAQAILAEMEDGDYSSLSGLNEHDLTALKSHIGMYGFRFTEKKELSREKGNYTYRISAQGVPLVRFTLEPDGSKWNVVSSSIEEAVIEEYSNTLSYQQAELAADFISACDYSLLYSVIEPTGYAEDTLESFEAFMQKNTPPRASIKFAQKDEGDQRIYDIVTQNSLFGRLALTDAGDGEWEITSFSLNESLNNAYLHYLADESAHRIQDMITNCESDALYQLCTLNGYPEGSLDRFDALLRSVPTIENAACSLFENSDSSARNYLVSTEDKRIASFTLSTRETGGVKMWVVSSFEMPIWVPFEGTVTAPACFTVTVDGKTLGAADEIKRSTPKNIDRVMIEKVPDMVTEVTYLLRSAFPPETIEAESAGGVKGVCTRVSDNAYRFDLPTSDDQLKDELYDFLIAFSESWGRFSMNDAPYAEMVKYVEQLSTAYVYIYGGDYAWIKPHYEDKTTFSNFKAENFVRYSDEIIACDISYDMTVVYIAGDTVETYSPAYRIYLRKINGDWKVFSFNSIVE